MSKITAETENRPHECGRSPEEKVLYPDPDAFADGEPRGAGKYRRRNIGLDGPGFIRTVQRKTRRSQNPPANGVVKVKLSGYPAATTGRFSTIRPGFRRSRSPA